MTGEDLLVWLCRDTVSEFHLRGGGGFKSVFDVADDYGCTRMLAVYDGSDPRSVEAVGTIRSELERREYRLRGENFRQVDVSKLEDVLLQYGNSMVYSWACTLSRNSSSMSGRSSRIRVSQACRNTC